MALARVKTWVSGEVLLASDLNSEFNNLLNNALTLIAPLTASLNAGGFKLTSYGTTDVPSARSDVPAVGQIQDQTFTWCGTAGGTANALTLTPSPAITAYSAGQAFVFKSSSSANTASATVAVSGLTTKAIQKNGRALSSAEIGISKWYRVTYDGSAFQLEALKPNDVVDVTDHGAIGDGSNDDGAAVLAAVNAAAATAIGAHSSRAVVYFPPGIYKVTTSAVLTQTNATSVAAGIHFCGAGMFTSILRLAPSGSDLYFYNNVATAREQFCTFSDLGFEGVAPASLSAYTDISDNAKGFRLWATSATGSHEQGFKFTRCRFFGLHTMFETAGDNTTSENSFVQCKISHIKSVVLSVNNLQSLNHEFHSTDIETIYGDVFSIGANGGGAIKVFGGSIIMVSDTGSSTYFLRSVATGTLNACPISFEGVRFELRGDKTNLVSVTTLKIVFADFDRCLFLDESTATKSSWVTIGSQSAIHFRRCEFVEQSGEYIKFVVGNSGAMFGINGEIIFESCQIPIDWSDKCSMTNNFGTGLISARNCFGSNLGASGDTSHWAHDFDLHWNAATAGQVGAWAVTGATLKDSGSPSHPQWRLKTAQIKLNTDFWPDTSEHTLKLPLNAIIKNIHLRKGPHASDATSTTMRIGRNDKSGTDHLTVTANFNASHSADVTNYFYHVGSTTNERTLRLYTNENPTGVAQGGLCIVEYY